MPDGQWKKAGKVYSSQVSVAGAKWLALPLCLVMLGSGAPAMVGPSVGASTPQGTVLVVSSRTYQPLWWSIEAQRGVRTPTSQMV